MDQNLEFLNDIYRNTKIGEESLGTLLKRVDDIHMKKDIITQMEGYACLNAKARNQIEKSGGKPQEVGPMKKAMVNNGIRMNAMTDQSNTHFAEMLIQGSTMGIVQATEAMNKYEAAEQDVKSLANEVVSFEQNNIERLKAYL